MTREEAIDTLKAMQALQEIYRNEAVDMAIEALSVDRLTGEWVSNNDGSWNCSECGLRVFVYAKGNFCPNCGTDMRHKDSDGE